MAGPVGCVAAVTYRCNARCEICDIWRQEADPESELAPEHYRWLPSSLRSVNVSGGEPFLRDDIVDVVAAMREACPRARIVISTNGLTPGRIADAVSRMSEVAVRVSVDAVGALHDRIRGVEGAFERAIETVKRLKEVGVRDLGLAATASEATAGEIPRVKKLADEMGVEFVASAVHSSPFFFGSHGEERPRSAQIVEGIAEIMRAELRSARPLEWAKAYYMRGLIDYVLGKPRRLACRAGVDFFFLDPRGDVFPCNVLDVKVGNVRDGSFEEIRRRSEAAVRRAVGRCREQCWMVCTVSPPMRRRPLRPIAWIAGAKLLGLDTRVRP
jgi:MoaA/NifB/PqqE/SkfB family radical SAM enzyme